MSTKCPICLQEFEDGIEECPACGFRFSGNTEKFKPIKAENTENDKNTQGIKEKLKKSIELFLISDEKIQKIKEAFDAYIFLSYRKKDRAHAQATF